MIRRTVTLGISMVLLAAEMASGAWEQPVGGAAPVNTAPNLNATGAPDLEVVGGTPYVAWPQTTGSPAAFSIQVARLNSTATAWERPTTDPAVLNSFGIAADPSLAAVGSTPYLAYTEVGGFAPNAAVRVRRLNAAGTAWEDVGGTLDKDPANNASDPSITNIGGVPYVAWAEADGTNTEIRVAHLNAAGNGWALDADAASPINAIPTANANVASLTGVNGVPWVAWREMGPGNQGDIHAAHLNAAGTQWLDRPLIIDKVASADAQSPSITTIGGVPWLAWVEKQGSSYQVRVAKYQAGNWVRVADGEAPINRDPSRETNNPSLASVDGVPFVAWHEADGVAAEVRVARLNSAGTAWERVADADSPINQDTSETATLANLADVGGVPYVAWRENDAADVDQIRISRLEPEFVSQTAAPRDTSAALSTTWRTYGVGFPLGFDYGASLEQATAPATAPIGEEVATVTQEIGGLAPRTSYQARAFASPPFSAKLTAPEAIGFQTPDTTPPQTTITKDPPNKLEKPKAKYKFTSSEPNSTFVCKFDKKKAKPCDAGKLKLKRLDDGKHKFKVIATDAAGNSDPSPAKDKFKVL